MNRWIFVEDWRRNWTGRGQGCHLMKSEKRKDHPEKWKMEERKIVKDGKKGRKSKVLLILSISRSFEHFFISMALLFILIAFQIKT